MGTRNKGRRGRQQTAMPEARSISAPVPLFCFRSIINVQTNANGFLVVRMKEARWLGQWHAATTILAQIKHLRPNLHPV